MLRILDQIPSGLLEREPRRLAELLDGPTLIHLPGRRSPPLFVSVLLHGNETSGWQAVRLLLARRPRLPRELSLFIGNVRAARHGLRRFDDQPDFNRIWNRTDGVEGGMARRVLDEIVARGPLACVDVHNTSGENPIYACVHTLDVASLTLARAFSPTLVFVTEPAGMLCVALAKHAPAVTLECGKSGNPEVEHRVADYLASLLEVDRIERVTSTRGARLLRAVATVRVPERVSFSFHDDAADLRFVAGLDAHNFAQLPPGVPFAYVRSGSGARLKVLDDHGRDVGGRYFVQRDGVLVTAMPLIPSLLTLDERIIRQDCLCYLMEQMDP